MKRWSHRSVLAAGLAMFCCSSAALADEPVVEALPPGEAPLVDWTYHVGNGGVAFTDVDHDGVIDVYFSGVNSFDGTAGKPNRPDEKLSEHWIGLTGNPADDLLRTHLGLAEGQGLLVTLVVESSPAARVGMQVNDILLSANDQNIRTVEDLAKIVDSGKGSRLSLRALRAGKPIVVEVSPERRPPAQTGETCPGISRLDDAEFLRRLYADLLEKTPGDEQVRQFVDDKNGNKRTEAAHRLLRESKAASRSCAACHTADAESTRLLKSLVSPDGIYRLQYQFNPLSVWNRNFVTVQPGLVYDNLVSDDLAPVATGSGALPADLEISVARKGSEPARITVKRGNDTWEATDADYRTKLPEDVRPYVERMLSPRRSPGLRKMNRNLNGTLPGMGTMRMPAMRSWTELRRPQEAKPNPTDPRPAPADETFGRIDRQLESLGKEMNDLRSALKELQKSLPQPPAGSGEKK